jgi:uncharacterized protein YqgC (DUF456 family)
VFSKELRSDTFMTQFELFAEALVQAITLFVLIFGLIGLLVPIFPGLTVMWLATLVYALIEAAAGKMGAIDWVLFAFITLLMLGGNVIDNIIIARHMRDREIPWSSILVGYAAGVIASIFLTPVVGLVASPLGLFAAEVMRLHDRQAAFASTKAYMTGWGWSLAARIAVGIAMVGLWMLWAWL